MKKQMLFYLLVILLFISGCDWDPEQTVDNAGELLTITDYNYPGKYNMVLVPVPNGGVTFPISIDDFDDSTSHMDYAYYIGETEVTVGLYYIVSEWATNKKEGERYNNIFFNKHRYFSLDDYEYPINDLTYIQIVIWCNAYTEWHNYQYNTNYSPVYVDETGKPIRIAMKPMNPEYFKYGSAPFSQEGSRIRQLYNRLNEYLDENKKMKDYLKNIDTIGNGFRIPTPEEWELAARWQGYDHGGIIKFRKGNDICNSASSAYDKSQKIVDRSNYLGIYDMSGNLREYVYYTTYLLLQNSYDHPFAQTRGGSYIDLDDPITLTISYMMYVDATSYNYFYGFRLAKDID